MVFKTGDVVELTCGSHHMTVETATDLEASVVWAVNGKEIKRTYAAAMLKIVPPIPSSLTVSFRLPEVLD